MILKMLVIGMLMTLMVSGEGIASGGLLTGDESVSVIGGADGPTSVFLAGKVNDTANRLVLVRDEDENENAGIATLPLEVTMKAVAYEKGALVVLIDNQSGHDYSYGMEYSLQKKVDGEWQEVEAVEIYGWPKLALLISDTEMAAEVYDLTVFGELSAGEYKLVKNELEAEFELAEP